MTSPLFATFQNYLLASLQNYLKIGVFGWKNILRLVLYTQFLEIDLNSHV